MGRWWIVFAACGVDWQKLGRYFAQTGEGAILQHGAVYPHWRDSYARLAAAPEDEIVEAT